MLIILCSRTWFILKNFKLEFHQCITLDITICTSCRHYELLHMHLYQQRTSCNTSTSRDIHIEWFLFQGDLLILYRLLYYYNVCNTNISVYSFQLSWFWTYYQRLKAISFFRCVTGIFCVDREGPHRPVPHAWPLRLKRQRMRTTES